MTFCVPFAFSKDFWPMQQCPKVKVETTEAAFPNFALGIWSFSSQDSFQLSEQRSQFSPKLVDKRLAYSKK